jgi:hypothetical protein
MTMRSIGMLIITITAMCWLFATASAQETTTDRIALNRVKNLSASELDQELSKQRFADWFTEIVGPGARIVWDINDCGEQTGSPADRGRDIPGCVEVKASLADGREVIVFIFVGTTRNGLVAKPKAFDVSIRQNHRLNDAKLHNLRAKLKQ